MSIAVLADPPAPAPPPGAGRKSDAGTGLFDPKPAIDGPAGESELPYEQQAQRLQAFDAVQGRPVIPKDLLHDVAKKGGGKKGGDGPEGTNDPKGPEKPNTPVSPDIILGPDGKIRPHDPGKTTPEVGIPERLPDAPPKPQPEVGCDILHQKCREKCSQISSKSRVGLAAKGLCYAGCFVAYSFCRAAGLIEKGVD